MKKAVIYGGGNIGRGFIGVLMSESGYEVAFINRKPDVVNKLKEDGCYPVRYVLSDGYQDVTVKNVTGIDGNDPEAVADAIAECDIMSTSLGARALEAVIPNLVAGIRKRWENNGKPLNIIICENLNDANKIVERMIKEQLTVEEQVKFDETVGLIEASIGRMVPVQTDEMKDGDPLRICVESYGFLPVDLDGFKGEVPQIENMVPFSPFDFYVKRKLFIHNMGHATCAYLGNVLGFTYVYESINIPTVRVLVQNAMLESAMALSKHYGVELSQIQLHITDLLYRFSNAALKDTCERVGGDPARKLSPSDRMIGSSNLALSEGIVPVYISVGTAAAVRRYINEAEGLEQGEETAVQVLSEVSKVEKDSELMKLILGYYKMLLEEKPLEEILKVADELKHTSIGKVI
ncbi:MAG: mannitol dehydrogenase [Eubacteriales bacterium]|nr:mannitol dehydrogenase [Eubacteriales bacterium]